eukprot:RCo040491
MSLSAAQVQPTVEEHLRGLFRKYRAVEVVIIADSSGAVLLEVTAPGAFPLRAGRQLCATFAVAAEQSAKLSLGDCRSALLFFGTHLVLQFVDTPLQITVVAQNAGAQGNAGLLYSFMEAMLLSPVIKALRSEVLKEMDLAVP